MDMYCESIICILAYDVIRVYVIHVLFRTLVIIMYS